uniref:Receptor protein kinase n=1 Tax=Rhizophora mucronata TaxID=61149 RepID=A0A2P2K1D6_RHIMU
MSSALLVISFPVPETYRSTSLSGIFSGFSAARLRSTRRRSNIESPSCKCHVADAASATSAAYGALLLGGGLFAFDKSKSKGSLLGGLTGATLMATSYFLMQAQETKAIGDAVGFGSAFLFSSVFGM